MNRLKQNHKTLVEVLYEIFDTVDPEGKMYLNTDQVIQLIENIKDNKDNQLLTQQELKENSFKTWKEVINNELMHCQIDFDLKENKLKKALDVIEYSFLSNKALFEFLKQNNLLRTEILYFNTFTTNTSSPKYKNTKGFVYIGYDKQKRYKIGSTKDLQQREKTFITGNLDYKMLMTCYVNDFRKAEQYLHNYFKDKQIKNEWFNLTQEDLKLLINNGFCLFLN